MIGLFMAAHCPGVSHRSWERGDDRAGQSDGCQGEEDHGQPKIRAFRINGSGKKSSETEEGEEDQGAGSSYRRS